MTVFDDFEARLSEALQKRTGAGASLGATLVTSLLSLLVSSLTSCLKGNSSATVAARAINPTRLDQMLMKVAVKNNLYNRSAKAYREDDGDALVEATFEACATTGNINLMALIEQVQPDTDWVM